MRSMTKSSWKGCSLLECGRTRPATEGRSKDRSCGHLAASVRLSRSPRSPVARRQQLAKAVDRTLGNSLEHLPQVVITVQSIELGGLHRAVERRRTLATVIRAHELDALALQAHAARRAHGGLSSIPSGSSSSSASASLTSRGCNHQPAERATWPTRDRSGLPAAGELAGWAAQPARGAAP